MKIQIFLTSSIVALVAAQDGLPQCAVSIPVSTPI